MAHLGRNLLPTWPMFAPASPKMFPGSPKTPKLTPTSSSWRHPGPSWPQLAANLCSHLRPNFTQESPPNRARNLKKRPQTPQDHPEGRQRAPGQPLGLNFSWFRGRFWTYFFRFFLQSLHLFFMASLPQVRHVGGLARAAHWINFGFISNLSFESKSPKFNRSM